MNCKTEMQVFGNSLKINDIQDDPFHQKIKPETIYTTVWTKEHLIRSDYVNGNQMVCPVCKHVMSAIEHGEKKNCPICTLEMISYGDGLDCFIENDKLEFYKNIKQYNL